MTSKDTTHMKYLVMNKDIEAGRCGVTVFDDAEEAKEDAKYQNENGSQDYEVYSVGKSSEIKQRRWRMSRAFRWAIFFIGLSIAMKMGEIISIIKLAVVGGC